MLRLITLKVASGGKENITVKGDYVRIRSATTSGAAITLADQDSGDFVELSVGDDCEFVPFKNLIVSHDQGTEQTIKIIVSQGKRAGASQVSGAVTISGTPNVNVTGLVPSRATGGNASATVTNASAQLVAASSTRNYLLVQNKSATGTIYLCYNGSATVANGIRLKPGESYELNCNVLTAAINAIGDIASNPAVVVVTG